MDRGGHIQELRQRIAELEAENAKLKEAVMACVAAERYGCGFSSKREWVTAFDALAALVGEDETV